MHLNLDHWKDLKLSKFSKEDLDLLDRARYALRHIELSGHVRKYDATYVAEALVHSQPPITLDFRAFQAGEIGQAYFSDKILLTDSLFEGDRFKQSFIDTLTRHFNDFITSFEEE